MGKMLESPVLKKSKKYEKRLKLDEGKRLKF